MPDPATTADLLADAARALRAARRVLVLTGAGLSADSGLPTYRGVGGLYEDGNLVAGAGVPIEVALSGFMMQRQPAVTWGCVRQIEAAGRGRHANAGHHALAELAASGRFARFTVLTQNVDGFHAEAGRAVPGQELIEMHGTLHRLECARCGWSAQVPDYAGLPSPPELPACPRCGAGVRPDIVLFGEALPTAALAVFEDVRRSPGPDFVMVVGTTAGFPYIAGPVAEAARRGVPTLEINPGESEVSHLVRWHVRDRAVVVLPELRDRVLGARASLKGWAA